jgi:hypothetical protein
MSSFNEELGRRPYGDEPLSPVALEARRELALDRLTDAFASDLVTMEDYEARVSEIQNADRPGAIDAAVADLPQVRPQGGSRDRGAARRGNGRDAGRESRSLSYRNAIDPRLRGEESVACILGNRNLQGDFLSGDKIGSFTVLGNTSIDLRDTALPPGALRIDAFCVMGNLKVIVPHGLPVKMNSLPILGDSHVARDVERHVERGMPHVVVNGFAVMGNLVVVAQD